MVGVLETERRSEQIVGMVGPKFSFSDRWMGFLPCSHFVSGGKKQRASMSLIVGLHDRFINDNIQ